MSKKLKKTKPELGSEYETPEEEISEESEEIESKAPEGHKRPSITDIKSPQTKQEYKKLIEDYKERNPAKYETKKSELEKKLGAMK